MVICTVFEFLAGKALYDEKSEFEKKEVFVFLKGGAKSIKEVISSENFPEFDRKSPK